VNGVPEVGKGRGVFEIFVPGLFLLVNLIAGILLLPLGIHVFEDSFRDSTTVSLFTTLIAVAFGYLLGVVLRVARANRADAWSARFLRIYHWRKWRRDGCPIYVTEQFPFIESLRIRAHRDYPSEAGEFFDAVWGRVESGGKGQALFNFCKLMVSSEDARGGEIYAAEALTRYMASICYALLFSVLWWVVVGVVRYFVVSETSPYAGPIALLVMTYTIALSIILRNMRFVRLKETETVFAVTFKNRERLFASHRECS
jgi:hypothetical protein